MGEGICYVPGEIVPSKWDQSKRLISQQKEKLQLQSFFILAVKKMQDTMQRTKGNNRIFYLFFDK
jgi:hypothetical protein